MIIQPIVEGHGETTAVPILLRRFVQETGLYDLVVANPIRRHRSELSRQEGVTKAVELALRRPGCRAILLIIDADDDCPKFKAPEISQWAQIASGGRAHCEIVLVTHEYEAWFLAAIESLRGRRGVRQNAAFNGDCEVPRDAKGIFEACLHQGARYNEPVDQPAFTDLMDIRAAFLRSRSFRRMARAFANSAVALGKNCVFNCFDLDSA